MPARKQRPNEFTTGEVAKMLRVAMRTVTKWCDQGHLAYWRIPGDVNNHRRITSENLRAFIRAKELPWPRELASPVALLASDDMQLVQQLRLGLGDSLHVAPTPFLAGRLYEQVFPAVIVADVRLGVSTVRDLIADLAEEPVLILAIEDEDEAQRFPTETSWRRPFDATLLVERIRGLLG